MLERVVSVGALRVLVAERHRASQQVLLDLVQQRADAADEAVHRDAELFACVAAGHQHLRLLQVFRPNLEAQRDTAKLPLGELPARRVRVAIVEVDADPAGDELLLDLARLGEHRLLPVATGNRHDDDLVGRNPRRQHEPAVVAVHHDGGAHEPRRHAPRCAPHVLDRFVARLEGDIERLREILSEVVRRARLQGTAVTHQRLDRVRAQRAGELLAFALDARDNGHCHLRLDGFLVEVEDLSCLLFGLGFGLVCRVPLLP